MKLRINFNVGKTYEFLKVVNLYVLRINETDFLTCALPIRRLHSFSHTSVKPSSNLDDNVLLFNSINNGVVGYLSGN